MHHHVLSCIRTTDVCLRCCVLSLIHAQALALLHAHAYARDFMRARFYAHVRLVLRPEVSTRSPRLALAASPFPTTGGLDPSPPLARPSPLRASPRRLRQSVSQGHRVPRHLPGPPRATALRPVRRLRSSESKWTSEFHPLRIRSPTEPNPLKSQSPARCHAAADLFVSRMHLGICDNKNDEPQELFSSQSQIHLRSFVEEETMRREGLQILSPTPTASTGRRGGPGRSCPRPPPSARGCGPRPRPHGVSRGNGCACFSMLR